MLVRLLWYSVSVRSVMNLSVISLRIRSMSIKCADSLATCASCSNNGSCRSLGLWIEEGEDSSSLARDITYVAHRVKRVGFEVLKAIGTN